MGNGGSPKSSWKPQIPKVTVTGVASEGHGLLTLTPEKLFHENPRFQGIKHRDSSQVWGSEILVSDSFPRFLP